MNKILSRSLLVVTLLLALNFTVVYGSTNGVYTYSELSDGTVRLDDYNANVQNVVIPTTIDGKAVSMIGTNAFKDKSSIRTISIPEGVKIIDSYAFNNCSNLLTIAMPTSLKSVSHVFYKGCPKLSYKMPSNLTKMSNGSYVEVATVTTVGTYNYDLANEVFALVNKERAKKGLKELEFSLELTNAAMQRAAETAVFWDHERPNSLSCFSISKLIDGENIGVGSSSPVNIMNKWMSSPGHKAQIIKARYNSIGIGCYQINGLTYWVQEFSENTSSNITKNTGKLENVENKIQVATDNGRLNLKITGLSENINLEIGQTISPTKATITNKGYSSANTQISLSDIKWTSSNNKVFTVDSKGTITAVGGGKATLTAILGESVLKYNIIVNRPLESISIPDTAVVYTNSTTNLIVTYIPVDTTDNKDVEWLSSNASIATVDNNGIVKGIKEGTVTITAKVGNKIDKCIVTIKKSVLENIYFSNTEETILISQESTILDLVFEPGTDTNDDTITWESSNSNIATVDENGVLTIVGKGKVTIKATTANGNVALCEVYVVDFLKGDLDKNGVINANDAAIALDLYKNGNLTPEDLEIGDMDNDGVINANDAAMILDIYKNGK